MNILRALIILGIVVAYGVSGEMNRSISTTGLAGRYLAWRRSGGLRSDWKSFLYFTGWHIYASDWGCCGDYGGCCLYMLTLRAIFTMLLVARVVVVDRGCVDLTATTTRPLVQVAKPIGHFMY